MKELQELRIVFQPDGVEYHVTYTHDPDAKGASGVTTREVVAGVMVRKALQMAQYYITGTKFAWRGYSTNYVRTTDSIEVDR